VTLVELLFVFPLLYLLYHSFFDCRRKKSKIWRFQIFLLILMGNLSNLYYTVFNHDLDILHAYTVIEVGLKNIGMFLSMYFVFKKASKPLTNRHVW
jgi:hypothetical protein